MKTNGAGTVGPKELTIEDKLDALIEGLSTLEDKIDVLTETQEELAEAVRNISAAGPGFEIDEFGGN